MAAPSPKVNTPEHTPRHRQPGDTCAQAAAGPGGQGTTTVRGTWRSAGDAGRPLRTMAGQGPGTPSPLPVPRRRERIATPAQQYPDMACTTLAHHLDGAMRADAFRRLNPRSAPGGDRGTWRAYKEHRTINLETVHEKLVNDPYGPPPVGRRLIPKGHGKLRPLGLPALEAKIVAKAVAMLLEAVYEQDCYDLSPGFRPGRRPQQALHAVRQGLLGSRIGAVIDCDISALFDTFPHDTRVAILRTRLKDGRVLERIERWRHAGLLDGKAMGFPEKGSLPGAVLSPVLANVYLHAGLDTWCETVVKAHCRGHVVLSRYADDVLIGGALASAAWRIREGLPKRFAKYGREINTEKTQLVAVGRPQRPPAEDKPGPCRCRGFGHYWGKTWRGGHTSKRKTEGKRRRRTRGECWRWCRDHRHRPLQEQYERLCAKRRGDYQYYGIRCNSPCLDLVDYTARRAWRYWLHRRGGRQRTWRACDRMMAADALPRPKIVKGGV